MLDIETVRKYNEKADYFQVKAEQTVRNIIKEAGILLGVNMSDDDIEYIYRHDVGDIPYDDIWSEEEFQSYYDNETKNYLLECSKKSLEESAYFLKLKENNND